MGMSTHVSGVRDLDGLFAKMAAIKKACEDAGIRVTELCTWQTLWRGL